MVSIDLAPIAVMPFIRCGICLALALLANEPAYPQSADSPGGLSVDSPAGALQAPIGAPGSEGMPVPGVGTIVKEMPRDLWRFLSVDTAIVLGVGGAAAGVAHIWDDDLADEVENSVRLNSALEPGHTYGSFAFQAALSVGMYSVGRIFDSSKLAVTGADIMRAQVVSQVWVQALKYTTHRTRPDGSDDLSFPSGHSASSFATAAVLQRHYGWKVGVPAYVVAGYVATARVHDNKHYLSDVVFGAAMGFAGERTVMHAPRYTVELVPAAGPKTASLTFVVLPRE